MAYKNIAERLRSHEILISNGIQDPVISSRMVLVGYRHEKMKKANTLFVLRFRLSAPASVGMNHM
ncbi:MAG: hypothetical protein ACQER7_00715 [Bacteroidota bacterium]